MKNTFSTQQGINLFYRVQGSGPVLVFLHGYASSHQMWQPLINHLSNTYTCYAIDLPGHGQSDNPPKNWYSLESIAQTISEFLSAKINTSPYAMIGHSTGGMLALKLAPDHKPQKLILLSTPINGQFLSYLDSVMKLETLVETQIATKLFAYYTNHLSLTVPAGLNYYGNPRMLTNPGFRRCYEEIKQCTPASLFGVYKAVRYTELSSLTASIRIPTLIVAGEKDRVVPLQQAQNLAKQLPNAQFISIPRIGHLPTDECPDKIESMTLEFLNAK